jgi:hypothetical protein
VITVAVVLIGSLIYFGFKHPTGLYLIVSAVECVVVVQSAHRLVLNLAKEQPKTAEDLVERLSRYGQLVAATGVALSSIGFVLHWMSNQTFRDSVIGISLVFVVGLPAYWLGGKRLLTAWLTTRGYGSEPRP